MGKQTGRKFAAGRLLATYWAPGLALAVTAALLAADYGWRDTDADARARGERQLAVKQYESAVSEFSSALRQNPANAAARLGLGRTYEAMGWSGEAQKQYEMAVQKSSETLKEAYRNLGLLEQKLGNKTEAERHLRAAAQAY